MTDYLNSAMSAAVYMHLKKTARNSLNSHPNQHHSHPHSRLQKNSRPLEGYDERMKHTALLLYILLLPTLTRAQIDWGAYSQSFNDEDTNPIGIILAIPKDNNSFWTTHESSKLFNAIDKDSSFTHTRRSLIIARTTFDTARAQFFVRGIGKHNAERFQYRVIEYPSNNVVVPWSSITQFTDSAVINSSALPQMAYLGGYRTRLNNMLIADVRETVTGSIITTAMIAWESIQPTVTNIYTSYNFDEFLKKLQYPWAPTTGTDRNKPDLMNLPPDNVNVIFMLDANIYHRGQVQYELRRDNDIVIPWRNNDYDNGFVWVKELTPGQYTASIRYVAQPDHVSEYRFGIGKMWYQTSWFKLSAGLFTGFMIGSLILAILFIRQRQKNREAESNKTKLQLELKAIYAQLNPHFVFNALSSIQGLINRQDITGANRYLSDFARLMRESLNNSNKSEIPLSEEIRTLETYLALEQLRFGFRYTITVDETINPSETNIPALLLQPLIENAVKHGVAILQHTGAIAINFGRSNNTLVATIEDNGKGFNMKNMSPGFGLKLTSDRLKLLNELRPLQAIDFSVQPGRSGGTCITLTFNHWFL